MTEEIQVWVGDLEVSDSRYAELSRNLSADECRRAKDLPPAASRRFVVGRGILRNLLAGFTGVPASSLRFTYGANGKPSLADHDISFNVSHSADLGVFAFAPDRPVGVDVENERPVRRLLDVAQRFLSEDELRSLAATPPAERDASFLRSWVVKEARLKAEGKGIWSGSTNGGSAPNLTHKLFSPRPGYIAAVAATDSDWRLFTCTVKH
ncbi:MAG TPA: 4'-phosphopantetheinyl transferase superfamily protein [Gemmatimonadaceae bacterium]|jgi:4'-phosphopantetheinyl transferase|nr:4'-phosphopantetheinyl transferase superfamily protein [Gemmatimonadaceae bacterium]